MPAERCCSVAHHVIWSNGAPLAAVARRAFPATPNVRSAISLLLVNRSFHAAVLTGCRGLLPVSYFAAAKDANKVQLFSQWLAEYGALAHSVSLCWGSYECQDEALHASDVAAADHALAFALEKAAAASASGHLLLTDCQWLDVGLTVTAGTAAAGSGRSRLSVTLKAENQGPQRQPDMLGQSCQHQADVRGTGAAVLPAAAVTQLSTTARVWRQYQAASCSP